MRLSGTTVKLILWWNNAAITGMPALTPFWSARRRPVDTILDVNLKGAFLCSQLAARHMVSRGQGVILNISSVGAFAAQQWAAAYCASKGGMEGLTKAMALDLAPTAFESPDRSGDIVVEKNQQQSAEMAALGIDRIYARKTPLARRGLPERNRRAAVFLPRMTPASFTEPR